MEKNENDLELTDELTIELDNRMSQVYLGQVISGNELFTRLLKKR